MGVKIITKSGPHPVAHEAARNEEFLRMMLRIRSFEERLHRMYLDGKLTGMSPHLSCGEEAMAVGVCAALREDDYILSTHRGHGHCLAKGAEMRPMMAELCGREAGYCKGRGGTMHIADVTKGILGANGIVGGGLPIACGVGVSIKYRSTDQVCVCFFGDAASNQGTFHEAVNMACAFKLPIIFVCENNLYGLSTPHCNVSATSHVADRAKGYEMPGETVDGMDVNAVYNATAKAVERARMNGGPTLIEGMTYRYYGHSASDPRPYRTREEEERWKTEKDPILLLKKALLEEKSVTEAEFDSMQTEAEAEAEAAIEFALSSPEPAVTDVMKYVYE